MKEMGKLIFSVERYRNGRKVATGGFADRIKGLVTARLLSVIYDLSFSIEWIAPAKLTNDFSSRFPWYSSEDSFKSSIDWVDNGMSEVESAQLKSGAYGEVSCFDLAKADKDIKFFCNKFNYEWFSSSSKIKKIFPSETKEELFGAVFNEILTYSPSKEFKNIFNEKRDLFHKMDASIGVQYRTGGVGKWRDPELGTVEEAKVYASRLRDKVIADYKGKKSVIFFVSSDSSEARHVFCDALSEVAEVIFFDDEPVHMDRSQNADSNSVSQVIMEHSLLSECSEIYVGKGAFGITAAFRAGKSPKALSNLT